MHELPLLPPPPDVLLLRLSRWIEQQCCALDAAAYAALQARLRPLLHALADALRLDDTDALFAALQRLAAQECIDDLFAPVPAAGSQRPKDPSSRSPGPSPDRGTEVGESWVGGAHGRDVRSVLGRIQQLLAPAEPPQRTALSLRAPSEVPVQTSFAIEVQADPSPVFGEANATTLPLPAGRGLDLETELVVEDPAALAVQSGREVVLRIDPQGRSVRVSFLLQALRAGHHRFSLIFRQHGMERRRLSRAVLAVEAAGHASAPSDGGSGRSMTCEVTTCEPPSGLLLCVRAIQRSSPGRHFHITISGPALGRPPLTFERTLVEDIEAASADFCRRIDGLTDLPSEHEREHRVRGLGEWLAKLLLTDEARLALSSPRIPDGTALHIESHDLWVPWEFLILDDRRSGIELFLGERFAVSRWIDAGAASESIGSGAVTLVAPTGAQLAISKELKALSGLSLDPVARIGSLDEVQRLLSGQARCGVLHFACHAENEADRVAPDLLILQDEVVLRTVDVPAARADLCRAISGGLVFINACQSAIIAPAMSRDRGWARAFIGGGAAALLACAWSVSNRVAASFAEDFYQQARLGLPLAEAARHARCHARTLGDHQPLGYVLYAAPCARLQRP